MKTNIIKNSDNEFVVDFLRIIFILIVFALIFLHIYHDWHIYSVITFLCFTLFYFLFSNKRRIKIENDYIILGTYRILNFMTKEIQIKIKDIDSIDYTPNEFNTIIILLPGSKGYRFSSLEIKHKRKIDKINIKLSEKEKSFLNSLIN